MDLEATVEVAYGRWAGRRGSLVGWHRNPGGARQQPQTYPIVSLYPRGRACARVVRVLTVREVTE